VRKVPLTDLGLPEGSRPRDVALTRSTVWVLFEPAVLVGLPRRVEELDEVETVYGTPGDVWETLSVSPRDGSIWIASASAARLWRKPPLGRVRPVRILQVKEGGFRDVLAGWDGVYVVPSACGAASVWRIDAAGKVLGTALPRSGDGPCPAVDLERDWSGRSWALFPDTGEAFRLETGDRWMARPELAAPGPWPERAGPFRGWFFWGAEPVGLGGDEDQATRLVRLSAAGIQAFQEDCGEGNRLLRVVGDSRGWVALTRQWLLLGEHALQSPKSPG